MKSKTLTQKINEVINDPWKIIKFLSRRNIFKWLPDKLYLKLIYRASLHSNLDLQNPTTFSEKKQWLKLYDRNPTYIQMVDKYEVRQYLAAKVGEEYLVPLLGVWDRFADIDFSQLPDQFVLKCTHDSGGVVICKDKSQLDIATVRKKINRCLKRNWYYYGREWPYKHVKPRVICEKYIIDEDGLDLKDYKVACFNGKAKLFFVCSNRTAIICNTDIYDMEWNIMPFYQTNHPNSGTIIPKPINFNKMVEFAEKLSQDIPFLRVDFYEVNEKLYMGELTFFHGSGFRVYKPDLYDNLMGSWIELPSAKDCKYEAYAGRRFSAGKL